MTDKYILAEDGKTPVPEPDLFLWGCWLQNADKARIVAQDRIGEILVSTVFLGLDHRFTGNGAPILWETIISSGPLNGYQERYTSYDEAVAGHAKALALAQERCAHGNTSSLAQ